MSEDPEPPLIRDDSGPSARRKRVTAILLSFGFLDAAVTVFGLYSLLIEGSPSFKVTLNLPIGIFAYFIAAWLVWNNKKVIWPIMTYLSALGLGCLLGSAISMGLGAPLKLMLAVARHEPLWLGRLLGYALIYAGFLSWLLCESVAARAEWGGNVRYPASKWLRPPAWIAYGSVPVAALGCSILLFMQAGWTAGAVERARQEHGTGHDYFVVSYQFKSRGGQSDHHATVLAYSDAGIKPISLHWKK